MRERFVHYYARDGRRRVIRAGRAAGIGARPPVHRVVGIGVGIGVARHQREAQAIRRNRPASAVFILHRKHLRAEGGLQGDILAGIVEVAGVEAVDGQAGITVGERIAVPAQNVKRPWQEARSIGECELKPFAEFYVGQVEDARAGVLQFEEFQGIALRGMKHDLRDQQPAEVLRRIERRLGDRAPRRAAARAGADGGREVDDQRRARRVRERVGGNVATAQARIRAVQRVINDGAGRVVGDEQSEAVGDGAAPGVEAWRADVREQAVVAELGDENGRPAVDETHRRVHRADPTAPGEGRGSHRVSPTGRLADDGALDFVAAGQEHRAHPLDGQRAAVEAVFLNSVGGEQAELGVGLEAGPDVLGVARGQRGGGALDRRIAGGVRAGAILVHVEQRVLGVVRDESEAAVLSRSVAEAVPVVGVGISDEVRDRCVEVAAVEYHEHVVDQVGHIDEVFVIGVDRPVNVQPLDFEVLDVVGEAIGRRPPQARPGVHVAVGGVDRVRAGLDLDRIVILLAPPDIALGEGRLRALFAVVKAPILAVDVEVIEIAARAQAVHGKLRVAAHRVAQADHPAVAPEAPRVVLHRAHIELVEALRAGRPEEWEIQLRCAVFLPEEEAEGVLGIAGASAEAAPQPDAAVDLEAFFALGVEQFNRARALPRHAILAGIRVDARRGTEHVVEVHDDGKGRNRLEVVFDRVAIERVGHNLGVHSVVDRVAAPGRGPAGRRRAGGRLVNHVAEEQIRMAVDVRREEVGLVGEGAQHRGVVDGQRRRVSRADRGRRRLAVERVAKGHAGRRARQRKRKPVREKAAVDAEFHVRDDAGDGAGRVVRRGCRQREVAQLAGRIVAVGVIPALVGIRVEGRDELARHVRVVKPEELAIGVELEIRV